MRSQKLVDPNRLMRRDVVGDYMNFLAAGLARDNVGKVRVELGRGVSRGCGVRRLANPHVKGGGKRERAVEPGFG